MRLTLATILGLCALASGRCGTQQHENIAGMHVAYQAYEAAIAAQPVRRQDKTYSINTYVYVITQNNTVAGGHISQRAIDQQMDVLNSKYQGTGFSFKTANTSYHNEPKWRNVQPSSQTEYQMKSSLRKGNYSDLNIYVNSIAEIPSLGQPLGYATFPDKASKRAFAVDGVVIDPNTFPNITDSPYNRGITLVHEVGHWLSLFHTFESHSNSRDPLAGCQGQGDYIFDTPAEGSAAFGCTQGRDTCKGTVQDSNNSSMPGVDPIHNYMDYSDDACLNTFSSGQIKRMMTSFEKSRLNYKEGSDGEEIDPETGHTPN